MKSGLVKQEYLKINFHYMKCILFEKEPLPVGSVVSVSDS